MAVRLPAAVVRGEGLKEGDELRLSSAEGGTLRIETEADRLARLAELRRLRGSAPTDFKFDREEANARGAND